MKLCWQTFVARLFSQTETYLCKQLSDHVFSSVKVKNRRKKKKSKYFSVTIKFWFFFTMIERMTNICLFIQNKVQIKNLSRQQIYTEWRNQPKSAVRRNPHSIWPRKREVTLSGRTLRLLLLPVPLWSPTDEWERPRTKTSTESGETFWLWERPRVRFSQKTASWIPPLRQTWRHLLTCTAGTTSTKKPSLSGRT